MNLIKNKQRVFITSSTHVRDVVKFHFDRENNLDIVISFNLEWFLKKFYTKNFYKKIFFKLLCKSFFNREKKIAFIVYNCSDQKIPDLLKFLYPNCTIYIKYVDILTDFYKDKESLLRNSKGVFDIDSYSLKDCALFDLKYVPNLVNIEKLKSKYNLISQTKTFLFIGLFSQLRFNSLCSLLEKYGAYDVIFDFVLYIDKGSQSTQILEQINCINLKYAYRPFTIINKTISYEEYLDLFNKAYGIIDFYRLKNDEGFSFRVFEAIATNKKIITNRFLEDQSFYNKDMIFNIDTSSSDEFSSFIVSKAMYNTAQLEKYQEYINFGYMPK